MELHEYQKELGEMRIRHRNEIRALQEKYAIAQSPFKVGDFVTDHIGTIKVDDIDFDPSQNGQHVRCIYHGPCYTKNGKPFKSGERRGVYQTNVKR